MGQVAVQLRVELDASGTQELDDHGELPSGKGSVVP
jgi:hypothetical protein